MRRAAVIDVGSNTIHLLVADGDGEWLSPVSDESVPSGLAEVAKGKERGGSSRAWAIAGSIENFVSIAERHGAEDVLLVGTQSVRGAADRDEIVTVVERTTGLLMDVLTPEHEALLCLAGAALGSLPPPPFLLVDIGGGSTDFALSAGNGVDAFASAPVGSGALSARYLEGDPPTPFAVRDAEASVRRLLDQRISSIPIPVDELVVTGGAARRLLQQAGFLARVESGHDTVAMEALVDGVLSEPALRWPRRPKDQRRAAVARAGGVIMREIARRWQVRRWRVSPYGLREGALSGYFRRAASSDGAPGNEA